MADGLAPSGDSSPSGYSQLAQGGPPQSKGTATMSDLAGQRLRRVHEPFLNGAGKFPHLRFLAVSPYEDSLPEWPMFPSQPSGNTLGFPEHDWKALLRVTDGLHKYPIPLRHLFFRADETEAVWQGGFYCLNVDKAIYQSDTQTAFRQFDEAVDTFCEVADVAANHFEMRPEPNYLSEKGHFFSRELVDRWLETLFSLPLWEPIEGTAMLVRRLRADVFTSSAMAIELLAKTGPLAAAATGDTKADAGNDRPTREMAGNEAESANQMRGPTSKGRGRRKADYETVQREARLAADWERARGNGVYKPDFATQNGTTLKKLDALLDRVAKRKARSDK